MAVVGLMQTSYFSLTNATLLSAAPAGMRGRVISLLSLARAMVTLGASLGGLLAAGLGVQVAQGIYGGICALAGVSVLVFARGLREFRVA